jgi:uncharacterized surface protein with fasciclin (FAS1) repeats
MKRVTNIIILIAVALLCNQCEDIFSSKSDIQAGFFDEDVISITKYVNDSSNAFTKFSQVLKAVHMEDALSSYNPAGSNFTLFLPSDKAFDRFINANDSYSDFNELLEDTELLISLARYHVLMQELKTNDFPFGALPDTTASGDYLTMGFEFGYDSINDEILYDSTVYKVNNVAPIIEANIDLTNGVIHVISEVLEPVVLSSYEWILKEDGFSIITAALQKTGICDLMGLYYTSEEGKVLDNVYTLLIEHDSIYNKNGIYSIDDLISRIVGDSESSDYTDMDNPLYQYTAYHILENRYFLDAFESSNYNTFANFPVAVNADLDIRLNTGGQIYDTLVVNSDTAVINYISVLFNASNVLTKNGAIHFVNQMLEVYRPRPAAVTFDFVNEEPILWKIMNEVGEHVFYNDEDFTAIKWEGIDELYFIKSASSTELAYGKNYLSLDGDFSIKYTVPKVLAGNYDVIFRANSQDYQNAIVQIYVDGKRIGGSFDLTSGGNPYKNIEAGKVSFSTTKIHTIEVRSLIPGKFDWDVIRFVPS